MTLIITTSLARVEASGSLLERLLKTTLEAASCHARCDGLTTEDLEDCLDVCSLVSQNPQTSICQFPRFCTGGCRAACDTERPEEEASEPVATDPWFAAGPPRSPFSNTTTTTRVTSTVTP